MKNEEKYYNKESTISQNNNVQSHDTKTNVNWTVPLTWAVQWHTSGLARKDIQTCMHTSHTSKIKYTYLLLHILNITIAHHTLGLKNLFDKKEKPSLILLMSF